MNKNVRRLTDGAMVLAIVGVFLLIDRQFAGVMSGLFTFLLPLPMVFYSTKYGMKESWVVLFSLILLSVVLGTPELIFYVASESLIGLIYGACINKHVETRKVILLTMLVSVLATIVSTFVMAKIIGYDFMEEISQMEITMTQVMNQTQMSLPNTINLHDYMVSIFLATVVLTGVLQGYITHVISRLMLKRLRIYVEPLKPIGTYLPPKWSGYVGLACFVAYMYTASHPLESTQLQIVIQAIAITGVFYLLMYGMVALLILLTYKNPKHRVLNGIIALLLMFMMLPIVAIAGYLYITTNLHKELLEGAGYAKGHR